MTPSPASPPPRTAALHPPGEVAWITKRLEDAGFQTWAVGGAVRDALTGRTPGDWDLTTAARPGDVQRLFRKTIPVGIDHGTVGVLGRDGMLYEVTTFRRDVETDGRHARVRFSDTVEEDLQRRDFTINAVAWHPLTHEVRDPHGGVDDLRARVLRTVGDPAERFREDRLRVLRALRFAGRFGLTVDGGTWEAARAAAPELPHLSSERVREELFKVLKEVTNPSVSLTLYEASGALASLYPELQACVGVPDGHGGDVWSHLLASADAVPGTQPFLRLVALLHDVGKGRVPAEEDDGRPVFPEHAATGAAATFQLLKRLKASNAEVDRAMHLVASHADLPSPGASPATLRRWLRHVGRAHYRDVLRVSAASARARGEEGAARLARIHELQRRARAVLAENPPLDVTELVIGGNDLRLLGIPPGPRYGEILRELLERVTDDPTLNERERLRALARQVAAEVEER